MKIDDGEQSLPDMGGSEFKLTLDLHLTNNIVKQNIDMFFGAVFSNKVIKQTVYKIVLIT